MQPALVGESDMKSSGSSNPKVRHKEIHPYFFPTTSPRSVARHAVVAWNPKVEIG